MARYTYQQEARTWLVLYTAYYYTCDWGGGACVVPFPSPRGWKWKGFEVCSAVLGGHAPSQRILFICHRMQNIGRDLEVHTTVCNGGMRASCVLVPSWGPGPTCLTPYGFHGRLVEWDARFAANLSKGHGGVNSAGKRTIVPSRRGLSRRDSTIFSIFGGICPMGKNLGSQRGLERATDTSTSMLIPIRGPPRRPVLIGAQEVVKS